MVPVKTSVSVYFDSFDPEPVVVRIELTIYWVAAIPKRVDKAFRNWEYVPYNLLTRRALEKPDVGKDILIMGQNGTFQQAPLDGSEEAAVEMGDWLGASQLAEELVQTHWGDDQRTRLASHHRAVVALVSRHSWPVAQKLLGFVCPGSYTRHPNSRD